MNVTNAHYYQIFRRGNSDGTAPMLANFAHGGVMNQNSTRVRIVPSIAASFFRAISLYSASISITT